jgi:alanyl-tRNA synthetase
VTGRGAYELVAKRFRVLKSAAAVLKSGLDDLPTKIEALQDELAATRKQAATLRAEQAAGSFEARLADVQTVAGVSLLAMELPGADKDALGKLADKFREKYATNGVCIIAAASEGGVVVMATVTQDLIKRGLKAGDLVGHVSRQLGAGGGGAPHLAFGGGKEPARVPEALASVKDWVEGKLK